MKIKCDVCGGDLVIIPGGQSGVCKVCGVEHSIERIREMLGVTEDKKDRKVKTDDKNDLSDKEIVAAKGTRAVKVKAGCEKLTETKDTDFVIKKRFGGFYELRAYKGNAQRVVFPAHCIEISDCTVFDGHDEIVELVFNGGFTNTGCTKGLFAELKNLKRVICHGDMLAFDGEFRGCENLEEVIVDNAGIIQLNGAVFADCVSLKRVEFDVDAEMDIGEGAFKNCKALESFVHPLKSVYFTSDGISSSAFEGCSSLRDVILADDTTAIHKDAFKDCKNLERVATHGGNLSNIAIHPEAFSGSPFDDSGIAKGICPKCRGKLMCAADRMECNCGFESVQYID